MSLDNNKMEDVRRYWVFAYMHDYPRGGINDLIGRYNTREEAKSAVNRLRDFDYTYIVDIT